jgi:predicted nucleic acid-binding protein
MIVVAAIRHGLVPLGTAGILLRGKRAGLLVESRPLLERLIGELGFFMADSLRRQILDQAGE